ncbi:MAG: chemotaxis response regulator protein-glutamate methylesterase [Phycisphaerales bacterium]|nr:chemotaxis response regulator protein-glutamate methylesterase [Phycisphaerales bacterium]MCB9862169.1 chemotaxis response regulator protein-glutamate methylesterase [Phycisphaerales bacterium]
MAIRVLIVDDSVFMRGMLKSAMEGAADIDVIATAMNGNDGLAKIESLKPDVVTLDFEMPGLTGLEVLEHVMKKCPLPVVMVSTKTQKGAKITLEALQLGAVDYVAKPLGEKSATLQSFREDVLNAVRAAAASNRARIGKKEDSVVEAKGFIGGPPNVVVAIGISAGGPATLHKFVPAIPQNFPPIVVTQHMPADFTGPFCKRLNEVAQVTVKEAETGDELRPGTLHLAPGGLHMKIERHIGRLCVALDDGPKVSGFRPSVDVLFTSLAKCAGERVVAVVMTGMGNDGSAGIQLLKEKGAVTLAQDQASSIVYGMPKAAFETGAVDRQVALRDIPTALHDGIDQLAACLR